VNEAVIAAHIERELPFMAAESILMLAVKAGGDRQELHERIREHSMAAAQRVKQEGAPNDLLERIAADPAFAAVREQLEQIVRPERFVGLAPRQVEQFLESRVAPVLERFAQSSPGDEELKV